MGTHGVTLEPLGLAGCHLVRAATHDDERGSFVRVVETSMLSERGLDGHVSYAATAHNELAGTVRGLHHQVPPHAESKTLWCQSGALFDVLLDLRRDQPTYGRWVSVELRAGDGLAVHVPPGVAHGYQTTVDHTSVAYLISGHHDPGSARTVRWDDPALAIPWPRRVSAISASDARAPSWTDAAGDG